MKKQFKRSLSLFMTVIMLMTCWVWIAPQKASAANVSYTIDIQYAINNMCEEGGHLKIFYWTFNSNGTVNTGNSQEKIAVNSFQDVAEGDYSYNTVIEGFPYKVELKAMGKTTTDGIARLKSITVGDRLVTGAFDGYNVQDTTEQIGIDANANKVGKMWGSFASDWPLPKFAVDDSSSDASLDLTAPGLPTSNTATGTGTANFKFKDANYGVAWPAANVTQNTPTIKTKDGRTSSYMTAAKSGSSATVVTAKAGADTLYPNQSDSEWVLTSSFTSGGVTSTMAVDVLLTHPTYTISFDANGGKLDASDAAAISGLLYGQEIGHVPTIAERYGYQLAGFRTGKTSGTWLEATTKVDTQGNRTWYAQWEAADINVSFVTADGQPICTLTAKYGKCLAPGTFDSLATLNEEVMKACNTGTVGFNADNEPYWAAEGIEYKFNGWKVIEAKDLNGNVVESLNSLKNDTAVLQGDTVFQATYVPKDKTKYTVSFYDANANLLSKNDAYTFGDSIVMPASPTLAEDAKFTYEHVGWAPKVGTTKYYTVDDNDKDENGLPVAYVSKNTTSFTVDSNEEFVPVFRSIYKEYTITFKYYEDNHVENEAKVEGVHYGDTIKAPSGVKDNYTYEGFRYLFDYWYDTTNNVKLSDATCVGNMTFNMMYQSGIPAIYTINFYDKDGNLINKGENENQYTHNSDVTAPEIDQTIDTDEALYTFIGFKDKNGNSYSQKATSDAEYYAKYSEQVYADIAFYNEGKLIYELKGKENGYFVGGKIPVYDEKTYGTPEKKEDAVGTYTFSGWKDSAGNTVVPGTTEFSGDIQLNAQFTTDHKEYTVKFENDGTVVSEKKYHYGDPIEIPAAEPTKPADETYTYDFKAWDPDVSEHCYGDVTYTATYRSVYNYYKVTWLKDDKSEASATNYIYKEKIQVSATPDPVLLGEAGAGYTWVINEWIRCNADGEPVDSNGTVVAEAEAARFVRGDRMGATPLFFYPTYKKEANVYTITFYAENGVDILGYSKAPYNSLIADYDDAFEDEEKTPTATEHYVFDKWVKLEGGDIEKVISDCKVKATYTAEPHNKQIHEVIKAPTCTETGLVNKKCLVDSCGLVDKNITVPVIEDFIAPDGQVLVSTEKWTLQNYRDGIDYDEVVYVGPSSKIAVNAVDANLRSGPWNPDGTICRRVGKIEYYVSETKLSEAALGSIQNWNNVYDYDYEYARIIVDLAKNEGITGAEFEALPDTDKTKIAILAEADKAIANAEANATGILGEIGLENGKTYIIYIKLSDREVNGQSNVSYLSTGTLHYGSTASTITVSGDGYGTKFCAEATVAVKDDLDGFTVTLDGEEIILDAEGEYKTTEKGVHIVSVVDKNGNKSTKTFEIKGNHTYRNYSVSATCVKDGSRYDLCTLCGVKANEEVLPATGHNFTTYTEKTATCVTDGYRMYSCANGCGETLQIKWNSADDVLAQAKKYDEATEKWESITAADVAHLKATGTHTYAKVKNEDGSDSTEDAWVIDKAATCLVAGSKHKDCTVCGARVTEEIPVDTTAHNYYRAKTAQEPTCTEEGWKNQTCKICGYVKEKVEMIPALGHTAGEYRIITPATCEAKGEKVLTCSVCGADIGKADENGNYAKTPVIEEIPALGHAWKIAGDPYKGDKVDDEGNTVQVWYQKYVCANDSTHTKVEETEYEEKVAAIVTFKNGDDDAAHAVIKDKYVGESIIATDVAEPTKAADATYKYIFAYWATKDADGKYIEAKFPIEIKGNETYYAVYTEKYINYTITYMKDDGTTQYKKVGYLHNGDVVELADGPAKSGDTYYTYTFAGWKLGDNTYTDKFTIDGSDVTLVATYTNKLKQYAVTYAYTKNNILETFLVDAGSAAKECYTTPVKEKESGSHYKFTGWNKAEQLKNVESNIYTTPTFEKVDHIYETSHVSDATCTSNAIKKNTCTVCGYFYEFEVEGTILNHDWVVSEVDGKNIKTCSRCGESESQSKPYTIDYYKDGKVYTHSNNVVWGTVLSTVVPTAPTKASDEYYSYTFKGWALKDDATETIINPADIKVKGNMSLVAVFDKTDRTYTVTFAYDAKNVIKIYKNVKAGSAVVYDGPVPTKKYDDSYHYEFDKWSATTDKILKDTYVKAEFRSIEHDNTPNVTAATCTTGQGTIYTCSCGWSSGVTETAKPLGHALKEMTGAGSRVEPTEGKDGYVMYECTRCDYVEKRVLKWEDPTTGLVKITVTVKDQHGKPVNGATVALYQDSNWVAQDITNANGQVSFLVAPGKYTVVITGVKYAGDQQSEITVNGNGSISGSIPQMYINDCGCACHRDNLWGTIFRLFHKIIKMITGEFKCCKDPSDLY